MITDAKVAGVVVLYNPDRSVIKNVESYINQIHRLYVVDNSEALNTEVIDFLKKNGHIEYIPLNGNEGIARALNYAAKRAIEEKYDYLLTMDQDSTAPEGMVGEMLNAAGNVGNIAIISPLHGNKFNTEISKAGRTEEVLTTKTSGNLLKLSMFKKLGKFKEEYFIDYVDIEYCLRIHKKGYKIIQVNTAKLAHNEGALEVKMFFGIRVFPYNHDPMRWYYKARNLPYMMKEYKNDFPELFVLEKKLFVNNVLKIILYEKNKLVKLKWIVRGICDFRRGMVGVYQGRS